MHKNNKAKINFVTCIQEQDMLVPDIIIEHCDQSVLVYYSSHLLHSVLD